MKPHSERHQDETADAGDEKRNGTDSEPTSYCIFVGRKQASVGEEDCAKEHGNEQRFYPRDGLRTMANVEVVDHAITREAKRPRENIAKNVTPYR